MNIAFSGIFVIFSVISDWFVLIAGLVVVASIVAMVAHRRLPTAPPPAVQPERSNDPNRIMTAVDPEAITPTPLVLAMIAAVVRVTLGPSAKVAHVVLVKSVPTPSVEVPAPHWSMEGRRQIYSSHQIR